MLDHIDFVQQGGHLSIGCGRGRTPRPVIEARNVLQSSEQILRLLCKAIDRKLADAMSSWPLGMHNTASDQALEARSARREFLRGVSAEVGASARQPRKVFGRA